MNSDLVRIPIDTAPANEPIDPYGRRSGYQSWQQTIRRIGNMKADELRAIYGTAIENLENLGSLTLRELVILKVYEEMLTKPNSAMLGLVMERDEGRVPQTVVSASGNVQDWLAVAKEENISIDEIMEEARQMISEHDKAPDIVDGEVVDG